MAESKAPETVEREWLSEKIRQLVVKKGKSTDSFKILDVQIKFIGGDEAFMLTTCYRACVTFEHDGAKSSRSVVVKKTPNIPQELFDSILFATLFGNEINTYKSIMPAYAELTGQNFNVVKFFDGEVGANYAYIILEDFSPNGWRLCKDMANLSLEHILLGTKYLAKFHAAGFFLRLNKRQRFDELAALLGESRYANSCLHPDYALQVKSSGARLLEATREHQPGVPIEFGQRLERMQHNFMNNNKQRVSPVEPFVTLCHGDYLRNNMAYKYADAGGDQPVDVMMFDLQTMRLASPMMDLVIFLALSAFSEVRKTHFQRIFTTYCDELKAAYLAYTPIHDLPDYLSQASLLKEYVRLLPYSISIAPGFLPTLVEPKVDQTSEALLNAVRTPEEIIEESMTRGGRVVNIELANQVKELYDWTQELEIDVFEGCDF